MASSYTTNLSKETDNQDNKSNQSSETSDESKNVLPTSPPNVEETIEVQRATIIRKRFTGSYYELELNSCYIYLAAYLLEMIVYF
jgi:hypothetical protein